MEPGDGSWLKTREGSAVRTELRERMLTLAVDLGITSVAVVWDRGLVDWSVNEVQVEILRWVYERISMCLLADEVAVVIADEPGGDRRDQREWLAETLELTDHGTEYVTPDRVVLPIVTTPSHHVPHLQLADLVVGATTAAVAGNRYALKLAPLLRQLAHKNAYGYAGGAGIKLFPNDLLNLHTGPSGKTATGRSGRTAGGACHGANGLTRTTVGCCRPPRALRLLPRRVEGVVAELAPLHAAAPADYATAVNRYLAAADVQLRAGRRTTS